MDLRYVLLLYFSFILSFIRAWTVSNAPTQSNITNFVPFGPAYGDTTLSRQLDAITGPIYINTRFPFFNVWHDQIRLYSHGLILFGNLTYNLPHSPPGRFPLKNFICASPYWADTSLQQDSKSNIFYREISDEPTLFQITSMVRNGFPQLVSLRMVWAFVGTWYLVPGHRLGPGRNTYQTILTTNGVYSFTVFTYHQLQWSSGLWGGYPQVGFNAGDQANYFVLDKSFTSNVITIVNDSNIGIPGQFIFHTTGNISNTECNSTEGLRTTPFRGSLYGGYEFRLLGICFNASLYTVQVNGQELTDCRVTTIYISCTMPMTTGGRLSIKLYSQEHLIGETEFFAFVPENNANLILSNNEELTQTPQIIENESFTLRFQSNSITKNYLFNIFLYDYSAQPSSFAPNDENLYNKTYNRIDLGLQNLNLSALGNLTIHYGSLFAVSEESENRMHTLSISFEISQSSSRSRINWFLALIGIGLTMFASYQAFMYGYCDIWAVFQPNPQEYIKVIPPCPCRVRADDWSADFLSYYADPACDAREQPNTCGSHKGAWGCYRKRSATTDSGAQCCYDKQGVWLDDVWKGAGTLDAYATVTEDGKIDIWGVFNHFRTDFLSYYSCCKSLYQSRAKCQKYYDLRPPGRCEDMLPAPSGGKGDPHLSKLDGGSYTFNGHGEYVFVKVPSEELEVQVRLAPVANDIATNSTDNATAIIALVVRNGAQERVQFELFQSLRMLEIRIDGRLVDFVPMTVEDDLPPSFSIVLYATDQLVIRQINPSRYDIDYSRNRIKVTIQVRPSFDFLDLNFILPQEIIQDQLCQGLIGDLNGLSYPNGTRVLSSIHDDRTLFEYGETWRTADTTSLFYYRPQDSHAQHQDLTYRPIFQDDLFNKYRGTSRYQMAEQNCPKNITNMLQCMYDILITNDSTISQMHRVYEANMYGWDEYVELVKEDEAARSGSNNIVCNITNYIVLCICLLLFFP